MTARRVRIIPSRELIAHVPAYARENGYGSISPEFVELAVAARGPVQESGTHGQALCTATTRILAFYARIRSGREVCYYCRAPIRTWKAPEIPHGVALLWRDGGYVAHHAGCTADDRPRRGRLPGVSREIAARREEVARERAASEAAADRLAEAKHKGACAVLAAHHEALADDPDRLPTDFIRRLMRKRDPCDFEHPQE